jgi:hypothetical protein
MMNCSPISWREQVTSNEWLLFKAKWWIVHLYHDENKLHPMSDCCLTPNDELFTYIMTRTSYIQWVIVVERQMMNCSPISWREQVTSNEWLLFNAKWWIVHLYHDENKLHPMSDCCLTPNDELFTYIMARTSYIQWVIVV